MKKIIMMLMTASLALATGALAQQEEASPTPGKKKPMQGQHRPANEERPSGNEAHPGREGQRGTEARPTPNRRPEQHNRAEANAPEGSTPGGATPNRGHNPNARQRAAEKEQAEPNRPGTNNEANRPMPNAQNSETRAQTATANPPARKTHPQAKKPAPQVVQQIKTQHANFKAQPQPQKVPTVTYNQNYRIQGAQQWQGPQYQVFRSYRPVWHDQGWYRAHYPRVEIIAGGAYYFNNGYWYPAWGYNPGAQYYAYDAPIYVGSRAEPPDRVIADVQAILQQEGYYKGEVDGLLGPLTREALTEYQTDNGLYATATIDEPTLASLNLS